MDTDWFNSWMAFVHFDRNSSPQPGACILSALLCVVHLSLRCACGYRYVILQIFWTVLWVIVCACPFFQISNITGPCRNDRLIRFNARTGQWVPRPFLKATDKRTNGNYSRISEALWDVFKDNYPGSGPEIKYTYYKKHHEKRKRQVTLSADHKEIIVVDEGDDDTKDLYPPQYWVINQEQCGVQKNENGPSLSGEEGEIARSSSCGLIIGDEEEEGGRMKKRGVYHQLVDVKQTALSTEDIDLSDDDGSKGGREESKVNSGYESMVDCTITSADRKNILSFFGSQGEDLDFHVSKDEVISEKYERGLGPVGKEENKDDGPMTIAVSRMEGCVVILC